MRFICNVAEISAQYVRPFISEMFVSLCSFFVVVLVVANISRHSASFTLYLQIYLSRLIRSFNTWCLSDSKWSIISIWLTLLAIRCVFVYLIEISRCYIINPFTILVIHKFSLAFAWSSERNGMGKWACECDCVFRAYIISNFETE